VGGVVTFHVPSKKMHITKLNMPKIYVSWNYFYDINTFIPNISLRLVERFHSQQNINYNISFPDVNGANHMGVVPSTNIMVYWMQCGNDC